MTKLLLVIILALLLLYMISISSTPVENDTKNENFVNSNNTKQQTNNPINNNVLKNATINNQVVTRPQQIVKNDMMYSGSAMNNLEKGLAKGLEQGLNNMQKLNTGYNTSPIPSSDISSDVAISNTSPEALSESSDISSATPSDMSSENDTSLMSTPITYDPTKFYDPKVSSHTTNTNEPNNVQFNTDQSVQKSYEEPGEMCTVVDQPSCDAKTCGSANLFPILDPRFNMRETAKQCLLLEDHLNNKKKRCFDCIKKHFLTIDGFLEEAVSLEPDNNKRDYYRSLYIDWIKIQKRYAKNPSDSSIMDDVSKSIRVFRKPLVETYFDTVSDYEE
jgi:hypothetical protein